MSDRYRDRRIPTSLDRVQGKVLISESGLRAMAARALESGVILFLRADLQRIPWAAREIIEAEAKRLYGEKPR